MSPLLTLDLFSGIGGFSLGLERTEGFETVAFCEINPFCRRVLAKHWPKVPQYDDIRTLTADRLRADGISVDVICGGFPCQDISIAGKGAGLNGARSGLWREYARLIGDLRPAFVIVENVSALLGRGLGRILGDLVALGFDAEWDCIPASAVGAPHQRDRIWIVAYPNGGQSFDDQQLYAGDGGTFPAQENGIVRRGGSGNDLADPNYSERGQNAAPRRRMAGQHSVPQGQEGPGGLSAGDKTLAHAGRRHDKTGLDAGANQRQAAGGEGRDSRKGEAPHGKRLRVESGASGADVADADSRDGYWRRGSMQMGRLKIAREIENYGDAARTQWGVEPDVGRVAHGIPSRVDRLRSLGNAVVPQIPEIIGRAIIASRSSYSAQERAA